MDKRLAGYRLARGYYLNKPVIVHLPSKETMAERKKLHCLACGSLKACNCDPKKYGK